MVQDKRKSNSDNIFTYKLRLFAYKLQHVCTRKAAYTFAIPTHVR